MSKKKFPMNDDDNVPFIRRLSKVKRTKQSKKIRVAYPQHIPVIIEPERGLKRLPQTKYLLPVEMTVSKFMIKLRQKLEIDANVAIYLLINTTCDNDNSGHRLSSVSSSVPAHEPAPMSWTFVQLDRVYTHDDGFLYLILAEENVFGNKIKA